MNIDVKNAFDEVVAVCDCIAKNAKDAMLLKKQFSEDICSFLYRVFDSDYESRYSYFNKVYFNDEFPVLQVCETEQSIPNLLKELCKRDKNLLSAEVLIAFFVTLGKAYLFSSVDKKYLNLPQYANAIKMMNDYVAAHKKELRCHVAGQSETRENATESMKTQTTQLSEDEEIQEPEETLEELLDKLNSLIGLEKVKKEVFEIINIVRVKRKAEEFGKQAPPLSLHLVFSGNPGTGKTTIARLLAKIYKSIGVLSKGQLVETDRSGLVGGYVGQTAIKTKEVIDSAMGGILFIDEAYTLTHGKGENDFGQEAVDTILKAMEDHRDDFIVIVAGYTNLMKEFIGSNPGLKSRFNQYIDFEDYKPDELKAIFCFLCKNMYTLSEGCEAFLTSFFENMYDNRSDDYANGRDVRNFFEKVYRAQANRIAENLEDITPDDFSTILLCDLKTASEEMK